MTTSGSTPASGVGREDAGVGRDEGTGRAGGTGRAAGTGGAGGTGRADGDTDTRGVMLAWSVVAVALLAVIVAYARARWPGYLPLGSDNDEYQLVGQQLARFEAPVVAGVEGTKYPLGYPAVLAVLEWLRVPIGPTALALNLVAISATTGLVAWVAGRRTDLLPANPGAALAAGGVVAASVSVWNDAFSIMPEMLTLAVVAGMFAVVAGGLTPRRLFWLSVLAVVAVLLKTLTVTIVLGGCTLLAVRALWRGPGAGSWDGSPWRLLQPAGAAVIVVLAWMVANRSLPEHTTGYLATFPLRDPFDASQGRLGPVGLLERAWAEVGESLADLGRAIAYIDASTTVAGVIAVIGLVLGVVGAWRLRRGGPLGVFVGGAVLAYAAALVLWPYHSSRFGIPLVPAAALGAGWLVRVVNDRLAGVSLGRLSGTVLHRVVGLVLGAVVVFGLVATSWDGVVSRGDDAEERLAMQHEAMARLEAWAEESLAPEDEVISFDYREVSRRLDRDVQPLAYTSDPSALRAMVGDADWIVMVDFHHTRNRQLELLLESEPQRYEQVLSGEGLGVWRVVGE